MKLSILRKGVALCALSVLPICVSMVHAEDKLVAKVGAVKISAAELDREQQKLLPFNLSFHKGVSKEKLKEIRDEAMNTLIDRAYKVNYALQEEMSVSKDVVNEKVASFEQKFDNSKKFEEALGNESRADFRASIYRQLLAEAAEKKAVDDKVNLSEAAVKSYYDANKAMFVRPKQFKASHIMVKIDPASNKQEKEALEKRANALYERAKAGEDFYNLAYYNSDDRSKFVGGDLGYFHEGQTVKEFETQILKMKQGEISPPVRTMYGYHIIKLLEINESRQLDYDEVKVKIRETLEKKEREKIYKAWMDGLKAKYPFERL